MSLLEDFSDILQHDKPLAPLTWMNLGGPAQFFIEPRDQAELQRVVVCCHENGIPIHVLGGGSNLLIRAEGVSGAVIRLANASFAELAVDGTTLRAGSGALLSQAISISVRAGLAGLEVLSGIPGTVGGALKGNAGGRSGEISETARSVTTMTAKGEIVTRSGD
ncbi:MAG: FAD-binding protein, partial [Planctomycetaceae bacterium]|nr:FAD-binding protein [Planctomycetaceae bacterium]